MIPIYAHAGGQGIGYTLPEFLDRFSSICAEHLEDRRAKAFAFILYDFTNDAVRHVLEDRDGFTELDRLSGNELSVFYLHDTNHAYVPKFNAKFLDLLGVARDARTPCVVFFRFAKGEIADASVANLDSRNLLTSFHELYGVLEAFRDKADQPRTKVIRVIKSTGKFVGVQAFAGLIGQGVASLL